MEDVLVQFLGGLMDLEKLSHEYGMLLFDTSGMIHILDFEVKDPRNTSERVSKADEEIYCVSFLRNALENGKNLLTTEKVLKELAYSTCDYKKLIKKYSRRKDNEGIGLFRKWTAGDKEKRKLENCFEERGKVVVLDENEKSLYGRLNQNYKVYLGKSNLSSTDYDLFLKSGVLCLSRGSSALVSNDFGIAFFWRTFLKRERVSDERFGFFNRIDIDWFSLLDKHYYKKRSC